MYIKEKICNLSLEEYTEKIKSFHGNIAPGIILSGIMVEIAMKNLPEGELFDVICETQHCMVDAVQLLIPCTVGNGWLKLYKTGRFSLTFYNKDNGNGVRVFVDSEKPNKWNEIKSWFNHEKPKKEQDTDLLLKQLFEHGSEIINMEKVIIKKDLITTSPKNKNSHVICSSCKEMYHKKYGDICLVCLGLGPYERN